MVKKWMNEERGREKRGTERREGVGEKRKNRISIESMRSKSTFDGPEKEKGE